LVRPRAHLAPIAFWAGLALACSTRPSFEPGDECELNNECAPSLVCRLGRCRVECRAERDCPFGLDCVRDPSGLGACTLESEASCTLASECGDPFLVCRFGRCTNACESDVDCPPGARCEPDDSGMLGCRDVSMTECELNSDCPEPLICAPDDRCREQCRTDRDCRDGTKCQVRDGLRVCGLPTEEDAGAPGSDAGTDAGDDRDGGADAGPAPVDGGADAGVDAGMMAGADGPPRMGGGLAHHCAQRAATAELYCWGDNTSGQLGDGTMSDRDVPVRVGLTGVTLASGGADHSCAVDGSGLHCWGANDRGQLGIGSPSGPQPTPQSVAGLPAVPDDLALGSDHTCAIADGRLFCWGDDQRGQIATGTTSMTPVASPTEVTLPATPERVSSFGSTVCARLSDGRVMCWGDNGNGQVGNGATSGQVTSPFEVTEVRGATHVVAGTTHTCAVLAGEVWCWGNNSFGQLGDGVGAGSRGTPMRTNAFAGTPRQIALGSTHTCARTASTVFCWGDNFLGQAGLDNGTAMGIMLATPMEVTSLGLVDELAAGSNHTCARDAAGVRCFGDNSTGQLGAGTTGGDQWMPQTVMLP